MEKMLLALIVGMVAAACAQNPTCTAPSQLTFSSVTKNYGHPTGIKAFVEYDAINQRIVSFEDKFGQKSRDNIQDLLLFKEKIVYHVDFNKKSCSKYNLTLKWEPFGVVKNATYRGEAVLGGPGDSVTIGSWSKTTERGFYTHYQDFTVNNCFPVFQMLAVNARYSDSAFANFYNVVKGIENPNDFAVPDLCQNATVSKMPTRAKLALPAHIRFAN